MYEVENTAAEPPGVPPVSTFLIRFWPEWSIAKPCWRDRIEHLQSGQHSDFVELEGIMQSVRALEAMAEDQSTSWKADE
jgi:hypothetical protein